MSTLKKYRKNIYSQNGEDGVIEEICSRLQITFGTFVEFGAWDGKHLSNTYRLLEQGWSGLHIEGDKNKFEKLLRTSKDFPGRLKTMQAYIEVDGPNKLDNLLACTDVPQEFEVLSIDIDSYDWHVWRSLETYYPTIVIIEINSSIPVGVYQTHRNNKVSGSSFSSTVQLGQNKGYAPVCHTGNLIFVRNNEVGKLQLPEAELKYPELLFDYSSIMLSYENPIPAPLGKIIGIYNRLVGLIGRV
jgi:hypothetical protein